MAPTITDLLVAIFFSVVGVAVFCGGLEKDKGFLKWFQLVLGTFCFLPNFIAVLLILNSFLTR